MKSTEKNTWQSRYCTTAAVVFITVTVIITIIGEEKAKEHCLPLIYCVTVVLTKVEPKTKFQL